MTPGLLSAVTFLPAVGAVALVLMPRRLDVVHRAGALGVALFTFLVSIPLWIRFDGTRADFQFEEVARWVPSLGVSYHVGVDGISLLLVLLTTTLMPITLLGSFNYIRERERPFYAMMLLLQTGVLGVFVATDLFLFFMFWEIMLVPMYFIIGIWGGTRRVYAAV
jgi:NADH-quinone oxidoreductase subunit M